MNKRILVSLSTLLVGLAWIMSEYARNYDIRELNMLALAIGLFALVSLFILAVKEN